MLSIKLQHNLPRDDSQFVHGRMKKHTEPGCSSVWRARSYATIALRANTVPCVLPNLPAHMSEPKIRTSEWRRDDAPSLQRVASQRMAVSTLPVYFTSFIQVSTAMLRREEQQMSRVESHAADSGHLVVSMSSESPDEVVIDVSALATLPSCC